MPESAPSSEKSGEDASLTKPGKGIFRLSSQTWKEIFRKILLLIYRSVYVPFIVLGIAAAVACTYLLQPNPNITLKTHTLKFSELTEAVVGPNGEMFLNEGGRRIIAVNRDRSVRFIIQADTLGQNKLFSGLTVDSRSRIYVYVTSYSGRNGTAVSQSIAFYSKSGRFLRYLFTRQLGGETAPEKLDSTATRMYVHENTLIISYKQEYQNQFYEINILSGKVEDLGSQNFDIPYLYQYIYLTRNNGYLYAKIDGDIGYGIIGKNNERQLYHNNFNINVGGPFVSKVFPLEGVYYCYDSHDQSVWRLDNQSGFSRIFGTTSPLYDRKIVGLAISQGRLCGCTLSDGWYIDYDGHTEFFDQAGLPLSSVLKEAMIRFCRGLGRILLIPGIIYLIGAVLYVYLGPKMHIFVKLLALLPVIVAFVAYLMVRVFNYYSADNAATAYERISRNVQIVSSGLNGDLLQQARDASFFQTDAYKQINNRMMDTFSHYVTARSDVTAEILVQGTSGVYVFSDTTDSGMLLSAHKVNPKFKSLVEQVWSTFDFEGGTAMAVDDGYRSYYAPIYDSRKRTVAYLYARTTAGFESQMFIDTILQLAPGIGLGLLFIAVALFLQAFVFSRSATRASHAIKKIAAGDFSVRVDKIENDEIGEISRSVNEMARTLEETSARNKQLNEDVRQSQMEVIASFASIVEAKSGQTGQHVRRVAEYVRLLASNAGYPSNEVDRISIASMMHDVGKLMIPSSIIEKPGRLTPEEFELMKKHTLYGEELLHNAPGQIMLYARIIAAEHHERYGGGGYPNNLHGSEINPISRMTSIADVFDALVSKRSYKSAWQPEEAFKEIEAGAGTQLDPDYVKIFLEHQRDIIAIYHRMPD